MLTWKDTLKNLLMSRQTAYRLVFNKETPAAQVVLKDLAKFCRANKPTFHPDPRMHAELEGRREVWLRIANHLNLTPDEAWALYGEGKE